MQQSKILRKLQKKLNISQEHMAVRLGTTRNSVQRWFSEQSIPSAAHTMRIVELAQSVGFALTVDELVDARFELQLANRQKAVTRA